MDKEDMNLFLEQVEKIVQCPVCLDIVRPPVVLCINGHLTCSECKNGARNCHMCRESYTNTSARVVEELLTTLPKPCPFEECEAYMMSADHSRYCMHREMTCLLGENMSCGWIGTVKQWLVHVQHQHSSAKYEFNNIQFLHFKDFSKQWESRMYHHLVGGENFLSFVWKGGNKLFHTFRHVECGKPKNEYSFLVTYKCGSRVLYKTLIEAPPLVNDSIESNPGTFYLDDLTSLIDGNDKLGAFIEAFKKP